MAEKRKNGLRVTCEGFISMETDRFMAGTTRHPARPRDLNGAWYATIIKRGPKMGKSESKKTPLISAKPSVIGHRTLKTPIRHAKGKGSISGKAYGSGIKALRVFSINLYGPNDLKLYRETKKFNSSGGYIFTGLPDGKYRLVVFTKADIAIGPHPSSKIVNCKSGETKNINFELK